MTFDSFLYAYGCKKRLCSCDMIDDIYFTLFNMPKVFLIGNKHLCRQYMCGDDRKCDLVYFNFYFSRIINQMSYIVRRNYQSERMWRVGGGVMRGPGDDNLLAGMTP